MEPTWFAALLLLVVAAIGYKILRGGLGDATFVIQIRGAGPEGVDIRGSVPGHDEGEVKEFVGSLELPPGAKIWAIPDRGRIALRFSAQIPEHIHQRLRNYFLLHV